MSKVNLTINGLAVEAKAGMTILEAAKTVGIDIPTFCHDPGGLEFRPLHQRRELSLPEAARPWAPTTSITVPVSDTLPPWPVWPQHLAVER
jgi:hypothetical protein